MCSILLLMGCASAHGTLEVPGQIRGDDDDKYLFFSTDPANVCPGVQGTSHYASEPNGRFIPTDEFKAGEDIKVVMYYKIAHGGPIWARYACLDGFEDVPADSADLKWKNLTLSGTSAETEIENLKCVGITVQEQCDFKDCRCPITFTAPQEHCKHALLQTNWLNDRNSGEHFKHCVDITIGDQTRSTGKVRYVGKADAIADTNGSSDGNDNAIADANGSSGFSTTTILIAAGCGLLAIGLVSLFYIKSSKPSQPFHPKTFPTKNASQPTQKCHRKRAHTH